MSMIIRDPQTSTGARVVGTEGRLRVSAETIPIGTNESFGGHAYELNSGIITLNSAAESGLLFVLNTGVVNLVFDHLDVFLGNSNITGVDSTIRIIRNPTAGTLISAGTAIDTDPINLNFGSANLPTATILTGAVGLTITASDGVTALSIVTPPTETSEDLAGIVVPPNASIAVTYTAPTGNTAQDVNVAFRMYELTDMI